MTLNGEEVTADSTALNYLKAYAEGVEAWFPDEKECWILGKLVSRKISEKDVELDFKLLNTDDTRTVRCTIDELINAKGENLPPLQNPPVLNGIDDLAMLSHLHEPAVFDNLRLRYLNGYIYTYSGIVLIAMNPFTDVGLYGDKIIRKYKNTTRDVVDPHVYAVAENALSDLKKNGRNQCIIVSGESGAGKTQSARYLMQYFTQSNRNANHRSSSNVSSGSNKFNCGIEETILSTNPIMESFGNSKTTRNNNSSRFGKYTEMIFEDCPDTGEPKICGARIRTYLLERSRVIFQPPMERNFHIFYQLCAGAPAAEREELCLKSWENFYYLNQGNAGVIDGVDDVEMFEETTKALSSAKISYSNQWNIFRICAAILHIGNIQIKKPRDAVIIDEENDQAFKTAVRLLGVDAEQFKKWILHTTIKTMNETIVKPLSLAQALIARDSVAKYLYTSLFSWIVSEVGANLEKSRILDMNKNINSSNNKYKFIGVLDIYGFEHFKENSFEQFCINYANEKLQQEFNKHVFKLEQEEYMKEKIEWSFITFSDNKGCIDLLESKSNGVFDILDEESRLQMGSDKSLLLKLNNNSFIKNNKFYVVPRFGQDSFTVKHYAEDVTYKIDGFLEKNRDAVPNEHRELMMNSSFSFLKEVLTTAQNVGDDNSSKAVATNESKSAHGQRSVSKHKTLGTIFRSSLNSLMDTISKTEVHYIRCIKPNYECQPFRFTPNMVVQQLRACGVLETIKISCNGYPTRATYVDFVDRYYMLVHSDCRDGDVNDPQYAKNLTNVILNTVLADDKDKFQMGLTKLFFKAGQLAYLEKLRNDRQVEAAMIIQRNALRYIYRKKFMTQMNAALKIQCLYRRHVAIKRVAMMRYNHSALIIQKNYRMHYAMVLLHKYKTAIVKLQFAYRYHNALLIKNQLMYTKACIVIQRAWRRYLDRNKFRRMILLIVKVQTILRTSFILSQVPDLLKEARSVGKLKETNYRLESKIIELSRKINDYANEEDKKSKEILHLESTINVWKTKCNNLEEKYNEIVAELADYKEKMNYKIDEMNEELICAKSNNEELSRQLKESMENLSKQMKIANDSHVNISRNDMQQMHESTLSSSQDFASEMSLRRYGTSKGIPQRQIMDSKSTVSLYSQVTEQNMYDHSISHPHSRFLGTSTPFNLDYSSDTRSSCIQHLKSQQMINEVQKRLIKDSCIPHIDRRDDSILNDWTAFFPAYIIGQLLRLLVQNNFMQEYDTFANGVFTALSSRIELIKDDDDEYSFWISNIYVLLRIIKYVSLDTLNTSYCDVSSYTGGNKNIGSVDMETHAVNSVHFGDIIKKSYKRTEILLVSLLDKWILKLKKTIEPMIIPAIIESQPLPGYAIHEKKRSGLLNNLIRSRKVVEFKIDDIINFLNELLSSMKIYLVEEKIIYQVILEIYTLINATAFNNLISRENFWTWMRGLQLSYNVSVLQDWTQNNKLIGIQHSIARLEHASVLISMNKKHLKMTESVSDMCFSLNTAQIVRIVKICIPTEEENDFSPEFLNLIIENNAENDFNGVLEVSNPPTNSRIEEILGTDISPCVFQQKMVPRWLEMPIVSRIINNIQR